MPASAQVLDASFSNTITSRTVTAAAPAPASAAVTDERQPAYSRFRAEFSEPARKWQVEVTSQLTKYVQMKRGWDGYNTPAPTMDAAFFALVVLNQVMRPRTPIPHVVPSSVGGVQLEWHENQVDLELHITGPYECEMWFQDRTSEGNPPISIDLSDDFGPLLDPIRLLTSR
jgi:hypothetical protein